MGSLVSDGVEIASGLNWLLADHGDHLRALEVDDRGRSHVHLWLGEHQRSVVSRHARFGGLLGRHRHRHGRIPTERTVHSSGKVLLDMAEETVPVGSFAFYCRSFSMVFAGKSWGSTTTSRRSAWTIRARTNSTHTFVTRREATRRSTRTSSTQCRPITSGDSPISKRTINNRN